MTLDFLIISLIGVYVGFVKNGSCYMIKLFNIA